MDIIDSLLNSENYTLFKATTFYRLVSFVDLIQHPCQRIAWNRYHDQLGPPDGLPISVHNFFCDVLTLDSKTVKYL